MILFEDTRNPVEKHRNIHDYCQKNGIHIERTKLYVGDYTLPTNQSVCIDTKADMQEVYGNVVQGHTRFKAELLRAQASGIRLVILVEQGELKTLTDVVNWVNPRMEKWRKLSDAHKEGKRLSTKIASSPPASSQKVAMIMNRLSNRYGVEWQFCDKSETGKRIIDILTEGDET